MTSSDIIAGLALLISLGSLIYTNKMDQKNNKKDKRDFLKLLSSSLRGINQRDSLDQKIVKQEQIIDELNYCSAFCDEPQYEEFRYEFDEKIYLIVNVSDTGDFFRLHNEGVSMLENFLKTI